MMFFLCGRRYYKENENANENLGEPFSNHIRGKESVSVLHESPSFAPLGMNELKIQTNSI